MCQLIPEVVIHKLLSDIHCPILSCLFRQCFHGEQWSWLSSLGVSPIRTVKLHFLVRQTVYSSKYISKKRKNLKVHLILKSAADKRLLLSKHINLLFSYEHILLVTQDQVLSCGSLCFRTQWGQVCKLDQSHLLVGWFNLLFECKRIV